MTDDAAFAALLDEAKRVRFASDPRAHMDMLDRVLAAVRAHEAARAAALASAPDVLRKPVEGEREAAERAIDADDMGSAARLMANADAIEALVADHARLTADLAAAREDTATAEAVLGSFRHPQLRGHAGQRAQPRSREAPCLRELLGEDNDGCGCMGCTARAYFAARAHAEEAG